ncbi:hypothetical protein AB0A69_12835 [Streptomyces sp. NPDC045431]|uniref:hypothetical protein n=1 Tax=Streptomyces sp. NPDC045431 TaxID=3155613 RepID=UPI0034063790
MGSSEGRPTVRRPREGPEHVCPSCGQPVGTALKRRKILGVWAPVWQPQPCRNPGCGLSRESREEGSADESGKTAKTG